MIANAGYDAGLNKRSKVERLGWAWKGARHNAVEKRLNSLQGVHEARKTVDDNEAKLRKGDIDPKDAKTYTVLIFARASNLGKLAGYKVFTSPDSSADGEDLKTAQKYMSHVPIGLVVGLLDRRKKKHIVHFRPWILEDPALKVLDSVAEEAANGKIKAVN